MLSLAQLLAAQQTVGTVLATPAVINLGQHSGYIHTRVKSQVIIAILGISVYTLVIIMNHNNYVRS